MRYRNSEMKVDQLVSYLNEEKINLSPAFQRGHVWPLKTRRKLVKNIVLGRPIPAIFLYKEAVGSKYTYNILDGKQRLESLILFIADGRQDVKVDKWRRYFFAPTHQGAANFYIPLPEGKRRFGQLSDEMIRDLREYSIPTIEISLDEDSSLEEVITLFVDINQQGEPVKRFDIVKALYKGDPLMKSVFGLIAIEQKRGQDIYYKPKKTPFTDVLKRLQVVSNLQAPNSKVDKMWEKLLELAVFARSGEHKNPVAILKEFITPRTDKQPKLTAEELKRLRDVFAFLSGTSAELRQSKLFTDQTHSYTVVTALLREGVALATEEKLSTFAKYIENPALAKAKQQRERIDQYLELSAKQTTHVSRRADRHHLFVSILKNI